MLAVAPTITVTPSQASITDTQSLLVTVGVAGTGTNPPIATGTVVLTAGSFTSGAGTLANGSVSFLIPGGAMPVGASNTITGAYTPDTAGAVNYTSGSGTATETVTATSVNLPAKLQGYKAQLAVLIAGVLTVVAGLKDLQGGFKTDQLDATDHGTNGWKARMNGLKDFEGSATLDYIEGDTSQQYLFDSMMSGLALQITLYPTKASGSGARSYTGPIVITDFKWSGKNTDLQSSQLTLTGAGPFSVAAQ